MEQQHTYVERALLGAPVHNVCCDFLACADLRLALGIDPLVPLLGQWAERARRRLVAAGDLIALNDYSEVGATCARETSPSRS